MAFVDLTLSATVGLMVRFSGLEYVFADFKQPTAVGWGSGSGSVLIDGEVYSWSQTIQMPNALTTSASYDPNKHRITAGGADFEFRLPGNQNPFSINPWLGLISTDPFRTDQNYTTLADTLEADSTTALVSTTTGWQVAGYFHLGIERVYYDNSTATSFTFLERGRFGSKAIQHRIGATGAIEVATGGIITTHPIVWNGRIARFWLVRGQTVDGVFVPDATAIEDETVDRLKHFEVREAKFNGATTLARVASNSISGLLDRQAAQRLPSATAGYPMADRLVRIDDTINQITWQWRTINNATEGSSDEPILTQRIQRDLGAGNPADVIAGWYTLAELAEFLTFTLLTLNDGPSWFLGPALRSRIVLSVTGERVAVSALFDLDAPGENITDWQEVLAVYPQSPISVLRGLGFEDTVESVSASLDQATEYFVTVAGEASRDFPQFYLPRSQGATSMFIQGIEGIPFDAAPGYVDDDGNAINGFVRIGGLECVEFDTVTQTQGFTQLAIVAAGRGTLGSVLQEIYIERGEDPIGVVQGLAFPETSWLHMMLYLMLGGSGVAGLNDASYDQGWVGSGVYIDAALVDVPSFEDLVTALGDTRRDNWAFFAATSLRDIMESEGLLANAVVRESGSTLAMAAVTKAMEAERAEDLLTLTVAHQHPDTNRRSYTSGENLVANALDLRGAWNHATDEPGHIVKMREGTSITTYGVRNRRSVDVKGIRGVEALVSRGSDLAAGFFAVRAYPRSISEIAYARSLVWDASVLDMALVDDDILPNIAVGGTAATATRGFTGALMQIFSATAVLPATKEVNAERGRLSFFATKRDGSRHSHWSPSARVNALQGAGTVLVCDDHAFSGSTQAKDVTRFAADYVVIVYAVGDYANRVQRTVTIVTEVAGVDSSRIQVSSGVALTPPLVVEFASYDDASFQDAQRRLVAMSDNDHKLDKAVGSDVPYKYT